MIMIKLVEIDESVLVKYQTICMKTHALVIMIV